MILRVTADRHGRQLYVTKLLYSARSSFRRCEGLSFPEKMLKQIRPSRHWVKCGMFHLNTSFNKLSLNKFKTVDHSRVSSWKELNENWGYKWEKYTQSFCSLKLVKTYTLLKSSLIITDPFKFLKMTAVTCYTNTSAQQRNFEILNLKVLNLTRCLFSLSDHFVSVFYLFFF